MHPLKPPGKELSIVDRRSKELSQAKGTQRRRASELGTWFARVCAPPSLTEDSSHGCPRDSLHHHFSLRVRLLGDGFFCNCGFRLEHSQDGCSFPPEACIWKLQLYLCRRCQEAAPRGFVPRWRHRRPLILTLLIDFTGIFKIREQLSPRKWLFLFTFFGWYFKVEG